jgi:hypothetical protein
VRDELNELTLHVFHTAPKPVDTPQPKRHALLRGMRRLIFAAEISAMTVYSAKVEHPMKWKISFPSTVVNLVVPSGMTPWPCVLLIAGQRLVLGLAQKMHAAWLHCGV